MISLASHLTEDRVSVPLMDLAPEVFFLSGG